MNAGLWTKIGREGWLSTLLFGLGLFAFEVVVSAVLPGFFDDLAEDLLAQPFFRNIVGALLGADIGRNLTRTAMHAMAWVHPVALALLWGHVITFGTRMPVAEIDRGTADVLFALPITRWQHYRCETAACLGSGLVLVLAMLAGHVAGSGGDRAPISGLLVVAVNLFAMFCAVAGLTYFVSSLSDRRGRAVGLVFALVLGSFFLSFLEQFWEPARRISGIGLLHYYRPADVLREGDWPVRDIAVLTGVGAGLWVAGGMLFAKRNICTT